IAARLGQRGQSIRRDPRPRGDSHVNALGQGLVAEVFAPIPAGQEDLDGVAKGQHTHGAVAAQDDWADVARAQLVDPHQLDLRVDQLLERVGNLDAVNPGRIEQPARVFLQPENGRSGNRLVATYAFKNGAAIADDMRQYVDARLVPGDEGSVVPYFLCGRHVAIMTAGS